MLCGGLTVSVRALAGGKLSSGLGFSGMKVVEHLASVGGVSIGGVAGENSHSLGVKSQPSGSCVEAHPRPWLRACPTLDCPF